MPFDVSGFSSTLTAVTVVVAVVMAAFAALNRETVKTLRENNGDLKSRVEIVTSERDAEKAAKEKVLAEKVALTSENAVLRSVVTGEAHLATLQDTLDNHHREALAALNGIRKELS